MQELKQANNTLEEINTLLKAAKSLVKGISVDLVKNHPISLTQMHITDAIDILSIAIDEQEQE